MIPNSTSPKIHLEFLSLRRLQIADCRLQIAADTKRGVFEALKATLVLEAFETTLLDVESARQTV